VADSPGIGLTSSDKHARDTLPLVVGAGVLKYPAKRQDIS
jgi:hypothetical protein